MVKEGQTERSGFRQVKIRMANGDCRRLANERWANGPSSGDTAAGTAAGRGGRGARQARRPAATTRKGGACLEASEKRGDPPSRPTCGVWGLGFGVLGSGFRR